MYRVRESKINLELSYRLFIEFFCHIFSGPSLKHMFERSCKILLRILKWFNAFQVLKWFSFLLRVACVICARAINTDIWQAIIARASSRQKTVVSHLSNLRTLKGKRKSFSILWRQHEHQKENWQWIFSRFHRRIFFKIWLSFNHIQFL